MATSALFNVQSTFGLTAPQGAVVQRSRRTRTVEMDEIDGANAEVALVCPFPYGREVVEISGRGDVAHATLTADSINIGTAVITSRTRREMNTKRPEFTIRSEKLFSTES
jgi:hypothetical protein